MAVRDAGTHGAALLRAREPLQGCGPRAWGLRWPRAAASHPTFALMAHVTFGVVRDSWRSRRPVDARQQHADGDLLLWTLAHVSGRTDVCPTLPRHLSDDAAILYGTLKAEASTEGVPWPTSGALVVSCELLPPRSRVLRVRVGGALAGDVAVPQADHPRRPWRPLVWHCGRLGTALELTTWGA